MKLEELKGIGAKKREALNSLDIFCVEDLIAYLPYTYRDLTTVSLLCAVGSDAPALFRVRCASRPTVRFPKKNMSITSCMVEDVSGTAEAVWFNQPYLANSIKDKEIYLYGTVEIKNGRRRLSCPAIEHEEELCITPVYHLPASLGINQRAMRSFIRQAVELCAEKEADVFDEGFRIAHHLAQRSFALNNVHFPKSFEALSQARRRLCFEELLSIQLYIKLRKKQNEKEAGKIFNIDDNILNGFLKSLPYELTNAQMRTVEEIKADLTSGKAMNRLVQGDVGSGKTVVAFITMLFAASNGGQAALMAPTEILARQHYEQLCGLFGKENTVLLVGSLSAAEHKEAYARIKSGEAKYIVGTNALIQDKVEYNNLLAVVCDEQHRFGVKQRARLLAKGNSPHTLVMSATPIPRTLSLIVFGDLDISIINELPKGRQRISTSIVPKFKEKDMLEYIRREAKAGRQAYIVCPLIEENGESPYSAEETFERLKGGVFSDISVALMHGKMKPEEKNAVVEDFVNNKVAVMISTTVIEVGVNVKNATIMVIYAADKFGLAQLHQLRGRVGRGEQKSYCFLLAENPDNDERLKILTKTSDGFEIAQRDYELRGPGDYLGKRQSGIAEARFSYALSNTLLLKETQTVLENEVLPRLDCFRPLTEAVQSKLDLDLTDIAYN